MGSQKQGVAGRQGGWSKLARCYLCGRTQNALGATTAAKSLHPSLHPTNCAPVMMCTYMPKWLRGVRWVGPPHSCRGRRLIRHPEHNRFRHSPRLLAASLHPASRHPQELENENGDVLVTGCVSAGPAACGNSREACPAVLAGPDQGSTQQRSSPEQLCVAALRAFCGRLQAVRA